MKARGRNWSNGFSHCPDTIRSGGPSLDLSSTSWSSESSVPRVFPPRQIACKACRHQFTGGGPLAGFGCDSLSAKPAEHGEVSFAAANERSRFWRCGAIPPADDFFHFI